MVDTRENSPPPPSPVLRNLSGASESPLGCPELWFAGSGPAPGGADGTAPAGRAQPHSGLREPARSLPAETERCHIQMLPVAGSPGALRSSGLSRALPSLPAVRAGQCRLSRARTVLLVNLCPCRRVFVRWNCKQQGEGEKSCRCVFVLGSGKP